MYAIVICEIFAFQTYVISSIKGPKPESPARYIVLLHLYFLDNAYNADQTFPSVYMNFYFVKQVKRSSYADYRNKISKLKARFVSWQ